MPELLNYPGGGGGVGGVEDNLPELFGAWLAGDSERAAELVSFAPAAQTELSITA